jgi:hypothetical protein
MHNIISEGTQRVETSRENWRAVDMHRLRSFKELIVQKVSGDALLYGVRRVRDSSTRFDNGNITNMELSVPYH